ncbi:carbon-nitrogen hydrolase family protein [Nonomuraea rubra]|uniref:Putative amidohydrolase n=1 Tax=Nonomuraea rubra TaxID=46180 RepID=A0A7X0P6E0_9ACTN|nr:carbon-nitrogen hydrolase family protein [Nonomuraea rubra]MBB6555907.1 putative amidohydrolase [Nonomuraea rubra]
MKSHPGGDRLRVAALQAGLSGSAAGDLPYVLERCAQERIDLLVLPECYFGGMPADRPAAEAVAIAPPYASLLAALADASAATTVVAGFTERSADGRLHSSAAIVREGRLVGAISRKLFPREPVFSPGDDLPLHRHGEHAFGVVICYDCNFIEPSRLLALAGARILACPLNNDLPVDVTRRWLSRSRSAFVARAVENDCWVITADVAGTVPGREGIGATLVVAPDGRIVAESDRSAASALVVAEIVVGGDSMLGRWDVRRNPAIFDRWRRSQEP